MTDGAIGNVIEIMRQLFDYVIVDCGTHIDATKVAAWERSQHLFYVLDQSIGAARCAWRFVDLCGRLATQQFGARLRHQPLHRESSDQRGAIESYAGAADLREDSAR